MRLIREIISVPGKGAMTSVLMVRSGCHLTRHSSYTGLLPHYRSILSSTAVCLLCISGFALGWPKPRGARQSIVNGTTTIRPTAHRGRTARHRLACKLWRTKHPNCTGTLIPSRVVILLKPAEDRTELWFSAEPRAGCGRRYHHELEHPVVDVAALLRQRCCR